MTKTKKTIRKTSTLSSTTLAESGLGGKNRSRIKRLNLLIYGPPGTAKTVNAHALPNTRTLDFDDGMQSVEWAIRAGVLDRKLEDIVYKTILPDPRDPKSTFVIDEASDTLDDWLAEEDIPDEEWDRPYSKYWDTIIIDSGSSLSDSAIIKGLKENDRLGISKSFVRLQKGGVTPMRKQDWGSAGSLFQKFINNCRAIGKNVVLVCHEFENTDEDGTLVSVDPLLIGQLRQRIPKDFDEVWYSRVKGNRNAPKYVFQTTPDPVHRLRSRLGCLSPEEPADFGKIRKKVAKFYGVTEDKLWVAEHGIEGAERAAELVKGGAI